MKFLCEQKKKQKQKQKQKKTKKRSKRQGTKVFFGKYPFFHGNTLALFLEMLQFVENFFQKPVCKIAEIRITFF